MLQIFAEFIQPDHLSMILFSLFDNYILRCMQFAHLISRSGNLQS